MCRVILECAVVIDTIKVPPTIYRSVSLWGSPSHEISSSRPGGEADWAGAFWLPHRDHLSLEWKLASWQKRVKLDHGPLTELGYGIKLEEWLKLAINQYPDLRIGLGPAFCAWYEHNMFPKKNYYPRGVQSWALDNDWSSSQGDRLRRAEQEPDLCCMCPLLDSCGTKNFFYQVVV